MPSYDLRDMVFGCFKGGSYGYAVRYLLLRSRDTIQSGYYEKEIRADGAAHRLCTRSGLCKPGIDEPGCEYGIYNMLHKLGVERPTIDVWYRTLDRDLIDGVRSVVSGLVHDCSRPIGKWVWVDHISPANARLLFPNARIFVLGMDKNRSFRNYAIKNRFEHTDDLELRGRKDVTVIDECVESEFGSYKRRHYKKVLRDTLMMIDAQTEVIDSFAESDDIHTVDAIRLFHGDDWQDEYERLCRHCGIEPNPIAAAEFIRAYASLQYDRSTYAPNPAWKWVNLDR